MSHNQKNAYRKKFDRHNLVILNELGNISFGKTACETPFPLLSSYHGKGNTIITTNLTFRKWETIFSDPVLTGAMIDHLAHKAHVLDISREQGGRFEEAMAWRPSKR